MFQLLPGTLLGLFEASDYMQEIGTQALRTISFHFLLAGFGIVSSSMFQALGHGVLSLAISLVRQLVVLLPAAWLLSLSGRLELVWWAFPLAELQRLFLAVQMNLLDFGRNQRKSWLWCSTPLGRGSAHNRNNFRLIPSSGP